MQRRADPAQTTIAHHSQRYLRQSAVLSMVLRPPFFAEKTGSTALSKGQR
jgi:hypothetical protein